MIERVIVNWLMILIYIVFNLLFTCVLCLFRRKITTPFGITCIILVGLISYLLFYFFIPIWFILTFIPCCILFSIVKYYFPQLNFNNKILSLNFNRNKIKNEGRVIGNCFPYYKKQLKYNYTTLVQDDTAMKGGTIITGSTGSGKTYSIINMIKQDLAKNKSVVFIDFKGDISTINDIESEAKGIDIYRLSWDECNFSYDPFINLDNNAKVEALLNVRKWSIDGADNHYKTGMQLFLQKTVNEYEHIDGNYLLGYYSFLKKYNVPKEHYDAYISTMKIIEIALTSNIKSIFEMNKKEFKFTSNKQFLLLISFPSASKDLGTFLTGLLLKDLMEVGTKGAYNPILSLYIDEFGSCQNTILVKDILEKGRSCNIATTLSMQDLNQLIINTNAPFLDSVLGTVNSYISYAGATRNTAEKVAGVQIYEIDDLLMTLKKPMNGKPPTAIFISKYPVLEKGGTEVYRFIPNNKINLKQLNDTNNTNNNEYQDNNELNNINNNQINSELSSDISNNQINTELSNNVNNYQGETQINNNNKQVEELKNQDTIDLNSFL